MNIDEKDLSTKQYQSKAHPRVSRPDEDSRGACGYQAAADERTQTPQCTDTAQAGAPLAARKEEACPPIIRKSWTRFLFLSDTHFPKRHACWRAENFSRSRDEENADIVAILLSLLRPPGPLVPALG